MRDSSTHKVLRDREFQHTIATTVMETKKSLSPVIGCKLVPTLLWPMNKGGGADHTRIFSLIISTFYGFKFPNLKEESCAYTYSLIFSHLSGHLMCPDITLFRLSNSLSPLAMSLCLHSLNLLQSFSCTESP